MKKLDRLTACAYVLLFGALAAVFALKPDVDNDFHAEYQRNLEKLEALAGVLQREQRNVQLGITRHYDFLEATLQDMEKAAGLVGFHPGFVDEAYRARAVTDMDAYRDKLAKIRVEVDATKRITGLLRNSTGYIKATLSRLADELQVDGNVPAGLARLHEAAAQLQSGTAASAALDLAWLGDSPLRGPLQLHADVVGRLTPLSVSATTRLQELLDAAGEPAGLRAMYLDQYYAAIKATQMSLLASYVVAGLLLLLSLFQVQQARRARAESDQARVDSELARGESERARADAEKLQVESDRARAESEAMALRIEAQLEETRTAVAACNGVLQAVARGEFGRRVELTLQGDLGELCQGVNLAAGCVEETLVEIERVMHAIRDGRLDVQVNESIRGRVRESVADAMSFLDRTFAGIQQAIEQMADGQFAARVDVEAKGDLARLKDAINSSMASLEGAIESINSVVVAQSNGVLTRRIERQFPGDLGVLAGAVNRSAVMLCEMMNEARQVAVAVSAAATQVNDSAGSVTGAAHEQLSALRSTLEGADLISKGISRGAESLVAVGALASEAKQRAGEGEVVLNKAQKSMNSIIESSKKIENIVGLIESIAFQTNLLALNAAVEAARAQEHGRGFAVVAGEVRNLAQQSAEASSSIKKLIQGSVEEVQRGAQDVHATGEAFESISSVVEKVNAIFAAMKMSSQEQEASMQRVTGHVRELDRLSKHNFQLAESNNESASTLSESAQRMHAVIGRFETTEGGMRDERHAPPARLAAGRRRSA